MSDLKKLVLIAGPSDVTAHGYASVHGLRRDQWIYVSSPKQLAGFQPRPGLTLVRAGGRLGVPMLRAITEWRKRGGNYERAD